MSARIVYFNACGRAERVRLLLEDVGAEWADDVIDYQKFGELKASGELAWGSVPAVHIDGKVLVQSAAIMNYLGEKYGIAPTTAEGRYIVDNIHGAVEDMSALASKANPNWGGSEESLKKFVETDIPRWFSNLDKYIAALGTPYAGGENPNQADYTLFDFLVAASAAVPGVVEGYANLAAYHARFAARPRIAAYLASPRARSRGPSYAEALAAKSA